MQTLKNWFNNLLKKYFNKTLHIEDLPVSRRHIVEAIEESVINASDLHILFCKISFVQAVEGVAWKAIWEVKGVNYFCTVDEENSYFDIGKNGEVIVQTNDMHMFKTHLKFFDYEA